jgi:hypothetical protein
VTQASSRAYAQAPQPAYDSPARSWLRVVAPSRRARRAPFMVLLAIVVGVGVLGLVALSIAVNQQAFALAELERSTHDLTIRHSTLRADVDRLRAPGRIERIARRRGLEPVQRARIAAWPGTAGPESAGKTAGKTAGTAGGQVATPPPSAGGRLWTVDDPHPIKHYLAQP